MQVSISQSGTPLVKMAIVMLTIFFLSGCGSSGGTTQPVQATLAITHYTATGVSPDLPATAAYPANYQLAITLHVMNSARSTVTVQAPVYGAMMFARFTVTQIGGPYHDGLVFDRPGGPPNAVHLVADRFRNLP